MSELGKKLLEGVDKAKAKAHEEGRELVAEKGEEGIDKVLDLGESLLDDYRPTYPDAVEEGRKTVQLIRENKTPFVRLGQDGFARLLGHWEDADEAAARRHYLEHDATYEERMAAMNAGTDALISAEDAAQAAQERAWNTVKMVLQQAGTVGLQILVRAAGASMGISL